MFFNLPKTIIYQDAKKMKIFALSSFSYFKEYLEKSINDFLMIFSDLGNIIDEKGNFVEYINIHQWDLLFSEKSNKNVKILQYDKTAMKKNKSKLKSKEIHLEIAGFSHIISNQRIEKKKGGIVVKDKEKDDEISSENISEEKRSIQPSLNEQSKYSN